MLPHARTALARLAPALALLMLGCGPALAQNSVRGPVQIPVPLQIIEREEPGAVKAAAKGAKTEEPAPQGKFPNRDTALHRQDYEMGTDSGADAIQLGRDEETGDTVMRHAPAKKPQPKSAFEDAPIQVRPIVPGGRYLGPVR